VAEPHVPMTLWEAWPVATPSVRVEPEIVQVNQFALGLEQEVAPGEGGGKAAVCARPSRANQTASRAHKRKRARCVGACLTCMNYTETHRLHSRVEAAAKTAHQPASKQSETNGQANPALELPPLCRHSARSACRAEPGGRRKGREDLAVGGTNRRSNGLWGRDR
jgi:hypothetical protein